MLLFLLLISIILISGCTSKVPSISSPSPETNAVPSQKTQTPSEKVTPSITVDNVKCTSTITGYNDGYTYPPVKTPEYSYTLEVSGTATGPVGSIIIVRMIDSRRQSEWEYSGILTWDYTSEWSNAETDYRGYKTYAKRGPGDPKTTKWSVPENSQGVPNLYSGDAPISGKRPSVIIYAGLEPWAGMEGYPIDERGRIAVATPVTITFPCNQ